MGKSAKRKCAMVSATRRTVNRVTAAGGKKSGETAGD
jgi:hypothetical protein